MSAWNAGCGNVLMSAWQSTHSDVFLVVHAVLEGFLVDCQGEYFAVAQGLGHALPGCGNPDKNRSMVCPGPEPLRHPAASAGAANAIATRTTRPNPESQQPESRIAMAFTTVIQAPAASGAACRASRQDVSNQIRLRVHVESAYYIGKALTAASDDSRAGAGNEMAGAVAPAIIIC